MLGDVQMTEFPEHTNYERYRALPSRQDIVDHYMRENKRSGVKFAEREANRMFRDAQGATP